MTEYTELEEKLGVVDYAIYQEYADGGKQDKALFKQFRDNVMDTLPRTGAILIKNAPILPLKDRVMTVAKKFFALEQDVKDGFIFPGTDDNRGYMPYKSKKPQDFKEFHHVDRAVFEALKGTPFENIPDLVSAHDMSKQLELTELIEDFREISIEFTQKGNEMGDAMMEVFADYFELSDEYLAEMKSGNSVLRTIHYPSFDRELLKNTDGATRAQAHVDASAVTFLIPSDQPGLRIVPKEGVAKTLGTTFATKKELSKIPAEEWIMIPPDARYVFMNAGRPLEIFSNGIITGTVHDVVPVEGREHEERFSAPFFKHTGWDMTLKPWQKAIAMRDGVNYFEEKGPRSISVREYVLDSDKEKDGTPIPLDKQKRPWIDPPIDKPIPLYVPS